MMKRVIHTPMLAHHRREHINRCVLLPLVNVRLALCARCLGFYPALFVGLTAHMLTKTGPLGAPDWWIVYIGQAPALVDWSIGRFKPIGGSNAIRILTGALAGLAFGRAFYLYFLDPKNELFWTSLIFVLIVVISVEAVRLMKLDNLR